MSEDLVLKFVSEHSDFELIRDGAKVHCKTTKHDMPARIEDLEAHLKSKKYLNANKKVTLEGDFSKYEPHIVPHKKFPGKLYCEFSRMVLNRNVEEIEKHIAGKKYKAQLADFEKMVKEEPDLAEVDTDTDEEDVEDDAEMKTDEEEEEEDEDSADDEPAAKRQKVDAAPAAKKEETKKSEEKKKPTKPVAENKKMNKKAKAKFLNQKKSEETTAEAPVEEKKEVETAPKKAAIDMTEEELRKADRAERKAKYKAQATEKPEETKAAAGKKKNLNSKNRNKQKRKEGKEVAPKKSA